MEWTTSETLALASAECSKCHGVGIRPSRSKKLAACACVFRAIFRACFDKFRNCVEKEKHLSRVTMGLTSGATNRFTWGRKDEEYIADFTLVAKRTLSADEYRIFKFHYLLGADWKLCCRQLNMERGVFFHNVYRIQSKLGKTFRELQPFALYPLDQYFSNTSYAGPVRACVNYKVVSIDSAARPSHRPDRLQVPVRKAA